MRLILSCGTSDMNRIILANLEHLKNFKGGFLLSYLEARKKPELVKEMVQEIKRVNKDIIFMMDSGAHSFIHMYRDKILGQPAGMGHEVNKEVIQICKNKGIDKFIEGYTAFMYRYQNIFDIFVEMDIQNLYGVDKIYEWREKFKQACGDKLMVVWHGEDDAILDEWCQKYRYVGVGGTNIGGEKINSAKNIKKLIKKYPDNEFHLFALTGNDLAMYSTLGLFSADSTSWKMGSRYGLFYHFSNGKIDGTPKYFLREDVDRCDKINLLAWIQYANYLNDVGGK